ncbi:MAG: hypothetical protein JXA74_03455 [Anaerolineae bacterium]|nr:hypothetical protein [Anaerolineae bacterium]
MSTVTQDYVDNVSVALDAALARTLRAEGDEGPLTIDLSEGRLVLFSDLHRGARNGADDFARCEPAYAAALAHYDATGHTLAVLGDAEELWEERPAAVLQAHRATLEAEARFHREGRYLRIWGNHDDEWQYPAGVTEYLRPLYGGPPLQVHEGLRLRVMDAQEELGHLFLVHGHQGDSLSSTFSIFSRLFVRYLWRPFQRLTGISPNTPATDWALRAKHNLAMYLWAERQPGLVLIAGHTHLPVFEAQSYAVPVLSETLADLERKLAEAPSLEKQVARERLQRELAQAQSEALLEAPARKPCHFDTGCCCYADGSIVGLEIAEGEMRLVRWRLDQAEPQPEILANRSLRDILAAL